jgi:deoxyribonucleoside regulator
MKRVSDTEKVGADRYATLANVALLYYGQGLTQGEIAKRMKVSRATIVNMLRECRESGIVNISVGGRHLAGSNLSAKLREKYHLEDVYIAQDETDPANHDRKQVLQQLARVTASAIQDIVEPGDRIGVAWGETIAIAAQAMSWTTVAGTEVCQLIGSMISDRVPASETCAIEIANRIGARCYTLHAPAMVSTHQLAERLRLEPTIRDQLARLEALDMTIASIGNVEPDTHFVAAGMATVEELNAAKQAGAVGIICCRFVNADGNELHLAPSERLIGADTGQLRKARKRLLPVCGVDRTQATLAALRGGLVTHLCVDLALAQTLLNA